MTWPLTHSRWLLCQWIIIPQFLHSEEHPKLAIVTSHRSTDGKWNLHQCTGCWSHVVNCTRCWKWNRGFALLINRGINIDSSPSLMFVTFLWRLLRLMIRCTARLQTEYLSFAITELMMELLEEKEKVPARYPEIRDNNIMDSFICSLQWLIQFVWNIQVSFTCKCPVNTLKNNTVTMFATEFFIVIFRVIVNREMKLSETSKFTRFWKFRTWFFVSVSEKSWNVPRKAYLGEGV